MVENIFRVSSIADTAFFDVALSLVNIMDVHQGMHMLCHIYYLQGDMYFLVLVHITCPLEIVPT